MRAGGLSRYLTGTAVLAGLMALVMVVAGCGGGLDLDDPFGFEDDIDAEATPRPGQPGDQDGPALADLEPGSIDIDLVFWHGGFKVTVWGAELYETPLPLHVDILQRPGWAVVMDATFENLGDSAVPFQSLPVLVSGGREFNQYGHYHDQPRVEPGMEEVGLFDFIVGAGFSFEDAVLVIGRPTNVQARIPLTPTAGELVSLEPVELPVSGQIETPSAVITVEGAELRADIPSPRGQAAKGQLALTLEWTATGVEGVCRQSIRDRDLVLGAPDGTEVAPDASTPVIDIIADPDTVFEGTTRFLIPDPPRGPYVFRLEGRYGGQCAASPIEQYDMPFEIAVDFPTS